MNFFWGRSRRLAIVAFLGLTIIGWHAEAFGGQLTATWDYDAVARRQILESSTVELGFSVERSVPNGKFAEIATTRTGTTSYTDLTTADATAYCYRVRAYNARGYSAYSNVACATAAASFGLAVLKMGGGSGTVVSAHSEIICGASCSARYPSGTAVTLTATPATGSTFNGWSGGGCGATEWSCTVTLTANTTVRATFALGPSDTGTSPVTVPANVTATFGLPASSSTVPLTVSVSGRGTVTSSSGTCGTNCSASYPRGSVVTLTATPGGKFIFKGWSGGCTGTRTCAVTLTAPATVSAKFAQH
jgi:List-Bact-rpt repeat protein